MAIISVKNLSNEEIAAFTCCWCMCGPSVSCVCCGCVLCSSLGVLRCVCVLWLVCYSPPWCVLRCVCVCCGCVWCSSLVCSSLCVCVCVCVCVCCGWCVMLLPFVFFTACAVQEHNIATTTHTRHRGTAHASATSESSDFLIKHIFNTDDGHVGRNM
jgi:hypothetical protein